MNNHLYTASDALAQVTEDGIELGSIFDKLKVDIDSYKDIIRKFSELDLDNPNFKLDDGKANWDAIAKAIKGCDETALSYFQTLDDGKGTIDNASASVEGMSAYLQKSGNMFTFASIKATLLNTALNAGIFLAASLAIQGISKALDSYIHRAENAINLTNELKAKHESASNELEAHRKTVDELAGTYEKLAKGVDTATNKNINLSDEDYRSYLDITNQLAEAFPVLQKTLDSNGNAILSLGENGRTGWKLWRLCLHGREEDGIIEI